ncbi:energy transducer TonB [Lysobacter capsici]|uniref:energy transducer TonB n=1 Tax=Lysobacter capsici TaxID=435897 RepID=UPI001C008D7D|nr:energy transducer TonB [Lysobacter capsici]QWF19162.1 energy transducer TonB [Lysobacter capsici]
MALLLPLSIACSVDAYGQVAEDPVPITPSYYDDLPRPPPSTTYPNNLQRRSKAHRDRPPKYPEAAACAGVEGTVVLILTVDMQGKLVDKQIERSSRHPELDRAAIEAAGQWRFDYEIRNGEPVMSRLRIAVDFVKGPTPPSYCAPRIELRKLGSDKTSGQFASSDAIEADLTQYAFAPTPVVASWRRVAANGQAGVTIHQQRLSLKPSKARQHSRLRLPAGTVAGSYLLEVAIDGQPMPPTRFEIK